MNTPISLDHFRGSLKKAESLRGLYDALCRYRFLYGYEHLCQGALEESLISRFSRTESTEIMVDANPHECILFYLDCAHPDLWPHIAKNSARYPELVFTQFRMLVPIITQIEGRKGIAKVVSFSEVHSHRLPCYEASNPGIFEDMFLSLDMLWWRIANNPREYPDRVFKLE